MYKYKALTVAGLLGLSTFSTAGWNNLPAFSGFSGFSNWSKPDTYQFESSIGMSETHNSNADPKKINNYGANITAYASPVKTLGLPLEEAAYLQKISFATLGINHIEHAEMDSLNLDGKYYLKNFYIGSGLGYLINNREYTVSFPNSYYPYPFHIDESPAEGIATGHVGLGIAPERIKGLEAGLNYAFGTNNSISTRKDLSWGGRVKYVRPLQSGRAFRINADVQQSLGNYRDDMHYNLGTAFFFNPSWSVGLNFNYFHPKNEFDYYERPKAHSYGVSTTKFIGNRFWLSIGMIHTKQSDGREMVACPVSGASTYASSDDYMVINFPTCSPYVKVAGDDYNVYTATLGVRF